MTCIEVTRFIVDVIQGVAVIIAAVVAVNIQSCKDKVKTILTVPGYDSAYHREFDSLRASDKRHYDSLFQRHEEKFQVYEIQSLKSDLGMRYLLTQRRA